MKGKNLIAKYEKSGTKVSSKTNLGSGFYVGQKTVDDVTGWHRPEGTKVKCAKVTEASEIPEGHEAYNFSDVTLLYHDGKKINKVQNMGVPKFFITLEVGKFVRIDVSDKGYITMTEGALTKEQAEAFMADVIQ